MAAPALLREPEQATPVRRVLIVDDSVVVRGLFSRWISEHPGLMVAGSAADGRAAIEAAGRLKPDLIILDLDMPEIDGLAALPEILNRSPNSIVLVASSLTRRNARLSLRCLSLGAVDVLPKPEGNRDLTVSVEFRRELVAKLVALCDAKLRIRPNLPAQTLLPSRVAPGLVTNLAPYASVVPRYLLIGASTGGPRAVSRLLGDLGPALGQLTTLVVQHMPPVFTASFADQIASHTGYPAREPLDGEQLVRGSIYIAPGGRHMGIDRRLGHPVARIDDSPPVRFCRPAVDVLFTDAARVLGNSAIGIILTGMGSDGTDGTRALRENGSAVIVQDEATSTVWGMPGSVVKAGLASKVMPIEEIGPALRSLMTDGGSK
jgi:two-component system, chemotaxis family, protein-glutamate methylesterase/glutaminase